VLLRRQIVDDYSRYEWLRNPQDLELPAPLGPPMAELGAPCNGFHCGQDNCDFITVNIDKL
jgi:hypothetical protein